MPISFTPEPGTILLCDFTGSIPPEMNKIRHVVVISPRSRKKTGSCVVVPFSTAVPSPVEPYHLKIPANTYPFFKAGTDVWAKGDLVAHVSFQRLDRLLMNNKWVAPQISLIDLERIRLLVWEAIGRPVEPEPPKVLQASVEEITTIKEVVLYRHSTVVDP